MIGKRHVFLHGGGGQLFHETLMRITLKVSHHVLQLFNKSVPTKFHEDIMFHNDCNLDHLFKSMILDCWAEQNSPCYILYIYTTIKPINAMYYSATTENRQTLKQKPWYGIRMKQNTGFLIQIYAIIR